MARNQPKKPAPIAAATSPSETPAGRQTRGSRAVDAAWLASELEAFRVEFAQQQQELNLRAHELELQNEALRGARREAEAARDRYAELYDAAPIGYFTLDPDGHVERVNAAGVRLLGVPKDAILGRRFAAFVAPDCLTQYNAFLARVVFPDGDETCELELTRTHATRLFVRLDGRMSGSGQEFHIAATDVTERRQSEAALAAARDAAEQANRAKSSFLANMSHEMRTPLHIIVGLGHLLRRDLADTVQQRRIDDLCANSDHLLELINDVLDLSRIEAGRLTLDRRPFRLTDVVDRLLGVVATPARSKGLELAIEIDPAIGRAALLGDPLRLAQVLINLGSNAVKFTERGSVRVAIACVAESIDGLQLRFTVQDSGIGIEPALQGRLFEVFSQADSSTTRTHGGSGLGLAISQRLVGMMGGRIVVDSQPGAGSRFSFQLGLPRGDDSFAEPAAGATGSDLGGRRVLFAEDHPLSQEILLEMLEELGCDVDVASDGEEAVECAHARDYDAILMDMQMPRMDGLAATQAIRRLPRHARTPIIALTANAFAEDRQRCFDAGMNDHLGKPVTPDTLGAALGRWLPALPAGASPQPTQANRGDAAAIGIPGLHPPSAMNGSAERRAEYLALVGRFTVLHGEDMQRLAEHLTHGRREDARKLAHDLKGIAGLIGARRIAELANEMSVALKAGGSNEVMAPLIVDCAAELARLTAAAANPPAL
jgi:PAS domain S-box-containing protein